MAKRVGDVRHVCGKRAKQLAEILRFDFIWFVPTFNFFTLFLLAYYICFIFVTLHFTFQLIYVNWFYFRR
jgi:hypothetical protein